MIQYTSVDRILAKLSRELPLENINELDIIEWIGEALEFLRVPEIQEEGVSVLKVSDYKTKLPQGLQYILQVVKYNGDTKSSSCNCDKQKGVDKSPMYNLIEEVCLSEAPGCNKPIENKCDEKPNPNNFVPLDYSQWICSDMYSQFEPVRLADHTFFNSIVCKEKANVYQAPCSGLQEYTIIGDTEKYLRFSFKDGVVAISYKKSVYDKDTGYPLIPDDISIITAITYYIKWKISETYFWNGRQGFNNMFQHMEHHWIKYARQAKNKAKMMKTLDEFQNHLERTHQLIPRLNRYYGFFGNMSREQKVKFYGKK